MDPRSVVADRFPKAVVAALVIVLVNYVTGETTALQPIATDFVGYAVAVFLGFVLLDVGRTWLSDDPGA